MPVPAILVESTPCSSTKRRTRGDKNLAVLAAGLAGAGGVSGIAFVGAGACWAGSVVFGVAVVGAGPSPS